MRSLSLPRSLIAILFDLALLQSVAERDAVVEHETFAVPAALRFRHGFQIVQDAALELINPVKTARQQIGAGLFAADAAGAVHRHASMLVGIEMARDKILELPKACDAGIERTGKTADRNLERVSCVDHQRIR